MRSGKPLFSEETKHTKVKKQLQAREFHERKADILDARANYVENHSKTPSMRVVLQGCQFDWIDVVLFFVLGGRLLLAVIAVGDII